MGTHRYTHAFVKYILRLSLRAYTEILRPFIQTIGLLCVHLLRTFMHIQVERIPAEYILERYSKDAHQDVVFERADFKMRGKDGATKDRRQRLLLSRAMTLIRHACMSNAGYERAMELMKELIEVSVRLEPDIGVDDGTVDIDGEEEEVIIMLDSYVNCSFGWHLY